MQDDASFDACFKIVSYGDFCLSVYDGNDELVDSYDFYAEDYDVDVGDRYEADYNTYIPTPYFSYVVCSYSDDNLIYVTASGEFDSNSDDDDSGDSGYPSDPGNSHGSPSNDTEKFYLGLVDKVYGVSYTDSSITIGWSKVTNADGYIVGRTENGKDIDVATVSTIVYTFYGTNLNSYYRFYVKPYANYEGKTYYGAKKELTFGKKPSTSTTSNKLNVGHVYAKPAATSIKKLKRGKKSFKVTVNKRSGVWGYQVQYSTKKSMKKSKKKSFTGTSLKVKGLKKRKTYYVRVRSYGYQDGSIIYSKWSKIKKVKTK